jgi:stage II sporulation protein D (peptidoglycan lytic transglycosylase)
VFKKTSNKTAFKRKIFKKVITLLDIYRICSTYSEKSCILPRNIHVCYLHYDQFIHMIRYILLLILILGSAGPGLAYNGNQAMEDADAFLRTAQYLEAVGAYQDILDRSPNPEMKAKAALMMGDIYSFFLNNKERALEKYGIVIKKYESSMYAANAHFNFGVILYEKDRYKEALNEFKIYVKRYPRGERRDAAEFMIEACQRPPPAVKERRPSFKKEKEENVRVLVVTGVQAINVDSTAMFEIRDDYGKNIFAKVQSAALTISGGNISLDGKSLSSDRLVIVPLDGQWLNLNGTPYRGELRIAKSSKGDMDVVNVLDVEAYLYGVVPKEMSPQWHLEALKAQAIAARTYVLYQKEKSKDRDYDVIATTASQVYGGAGVESAMSNQAVDETKGRVLLYDGQLALTYFHANSGGMTEEARRLWGADVPYLRAVRDDYSVKAPGCLWKLSLNMDKIRSALNRKGLDVGQIERVVPVDVSPSGRVTKIKIFHGGRESVMTGDDFRLKTDPTQIKSTLFTMTNEGDEIHFEGKGSGHGVGMSQWGAYIMAREGFSHGDILKHYYYGVELR